MAGWRRSCMAPYIYLPGGNTDAMSAAYDIRFLSLHASDYHNERLRAHPEYPREDNYVTKVILAGAQVAGFPGKSEILLTCMEEQRTDCAALGVEKGLIPTFEQYAARIDAFIAAGMKSECHDPYGDRMKDMKQRHEKSKAEESAAEQDKDSQ